MKFTLPKSADDLPIKDGKLLMRSLSVYEILRRFSHIIRLSPFRFEDFAASLLAEDQSALLAEVHINLLKTLIREDRQQQTWLGPTDIRDSANLYMHLTDHTNWSSSLKIYLSADVSTNSDILHKLTTDENKFYPFNVGIGMRLTVLEHLCDQFLLSVLARDEIVNGSQFVGKNETTCRQCNKGNGDLIGCINCTATYHLRCSDPPLDCYPDIEKGEPEYLCPLCQSNSLTGVTDCISDEEKSGNLKRHEPIGLDELGRRYWFIARRLFVVDELEDDVRYYTTLSQFKQLVECLEEVGFGEELGENLTLLNSEITRQIKITEDLQATLLKEHRREDGSYSIQLGQDGTHRGYLNHYSTNSIASKLQPDKDIIRSLNNKFCMSALNSYKWFGATDGSMSTLTMTIKTSILKLESTIPSTFIHPCWQSQKREWVKFVDSAQDASNYGEALSKLERCIKPILFKPSWYDSLGFLQLFRSTVTEREELKKVERQPRGFERNEKVNADFEQSYRLGTMVKFSSKLKPVKHQVWKQKGEEYRLTGLNAWYWQAKTYRSRPKQDKPRKLDMNLRIFNKQTTTNGTAKSNEISSSAVKAHSLSAGQGFNLVAVDKNQQALLNRCRPKLPPYHDYHTNSAKILSILVLPELELRRLARSAGQREVKGFSYTAKQNIHIWPYGMTPRPVLRTCWLYKNQLLSSFQDVALQLKVLHSCIRWDELQVRPPASGHNTIVTDDTTVTIELLKKREKLPYLTHSEYLIRKTTTPNDLAEPKKKKNKSGPRPINNDSMNSSLTPSRSGLRARRPVEKQEEKGPTREELWVPEDQLELWELKQFDEKIERQNALLRERALREEAERRRRLEEERRRAAEQERRKARAQEEAAKQARLMSTSTYSASANNSSSTAMAANKTTPAKTNRINIPNNQQGHIVRAPNPPGQQAATPVLRYFRTEGGQIIRLPASYLQLGTPLILRHVNPGNPSQTNTYIIRPQAVAGPATTVPASGEKPIFGYSVQVPKEASSLKDSAPAAQDQQQQQQQEQEPEKQTQTQAATTQPDQTEPQSSEAPAWQPPTPKAPAAATAPEAAPLLSSSQPSPAPSPPAPPPQPLEFAPPPTPQPCSPAKVTVPLAAAPMSDERPETAQSKPPESASTSVGTDPNEMAHDRSVPEAETQSAASSAPVVPPATNTTSTAASAAIAAERPTKLAAECSNKM